MNCCNANGNCTQGRDCPIRKQRAKETNDAYINGHKKPDKPYEDIAVTFVAETFKTLIAIIALVAGIALLALVIWGK